MQNHGGVWNFIFLIDGIWWDVSGPVLATRCDSLSLFVWLPVYHFQPMIDCFARSTFKGANYTKWELLEVEKYV